MAYKTIVVFYMYGGHDALNMLVPLDNYERYAEYRGDITPEESSLIPLGIGHGNMAIHGHFSRMAGMILSGMAAPILGTGSLCEPTTRETYDQKSVTLPPFLFSHSHQQAFNKGAYNLYSGWAGRVLDAWYAGTTIPGPIGPAITTASDRALVSAETIDVSQLRNQGETWQGLTYNKQDALSRVADSELYDHLVERVACQVVKTAIDGQNYLKDLFGQFEESGKLNTSATVASKLIAAAEQLGHERQIIHVPAESWDTHHNQLDTMNWKYPVMDDLFADFIEELEGYGVADRVVCVTASDFGRSLTTNGRGTDHGWGSQQLVWGLPVAGGVHRLRRSGLLDRRQAYDSQAGRHPDLCHFGQMVWTQRQRDRRCFPRSGQFRYA